MDSPSKTVRKQKKPSFFKIMIKDFSADGMEIPPAFTKKFGKQIPNTTRLEVKGYHEKSWEVEVEKNGKIHCFNEGWREFVEENHLEEFDSLVFKYLADSKSFKVTIYGRTCCMKEFPVSRERNSELVNGNSQRNVQDGGKRKRVHEDHDDSNTDQIMKSARTNKSELDGDKAYERDVIRIDSDDEDIGALKETVWKGRTKKNCIEDNKTSKRKKKCNRLLQIKFNSKNPSFEAELTPTHISGGFVHIPMWFTVKHLSMKTEKVAKFHRGKNIWQMRIYMIGNIDKKGTKKARISRGWPDFVKDNGLELKDVCVFEMIESNVFHVHVYRKEGDKKEFVKIS